MPAGLTGEADGARDEPPDPELTAAALEALEDLPTGQREAVVLTKLDGKSVAEAAEIAGTTVGAMKVRAHRGYEALRKLLGGRQRRRRMTKTSDVIDSLAVAPPPTPPPLSPALEAELGKLAPVAPRRPMRQLATLVGISLVYAAGLVAMFTGTRRPRRAADAVAARRRRSPGCSDSSSPATSRWCRAPAR